MRITQQQSKGSQIWDNKLNTQPIDLVRSLRTDEKRVLTSGNAGKVLPLAHIPMFREDEMRTSRFSVAIEMEETAEMLMNAVTVKVMAHFVPKLAFDRFNGIDSFNRSYLGQEEADGTVIPFFEMIDPWQSPARMNDLYRVMGVHCPPDQEVNTDLAESYNCLWTWRAKMRSKELTADHKPLTSAYLRPAFWNHTAMKHIKPDFDQALIDGEVPLNVTEGSLPIRGRFPHDSQGTGGGGVFANAPAFATASATPEHPPQLGTTGVYDYAGSIWAQMEQDGITVSLSNIEMAKKTAAFARMRQQYQSIDDDGLIDLLMRGISIPSQAMQQPILLDQKEGIIGMSQRYATDGENLDLSATRGVFGTELILRMPRTNTGGMILITAEIVPEQLFERQKDYALFAESVSDLPDPLADYLDPEPVEVVLNEHADVMHTAPKQVFGYAPLNNKWLRKGPNIGGKFQRVDPEATFDENRQRIWAVESVDPILTTDFYLVNDIHHNVFADTVADSFEVLVSGTAQIVGDTFFGPALLEATDDYDKIMDQVDQERINMPNSASDDDGEATEEGTDE